MRKPVRVNSEQTLRLRGVLALLGIEPSPGYTIYVTDTRRGRCSYGNKNITVPLWSTITNARGAVDATYEIYYAAHECAHSWCYEESGEKNHGCTFMEWFMLLCPDHLQHHEIGYKPRLAAAAGITLEGKTDEKR